MSSGAALLAQDINALANAARTSMPPDDVAEKVRMLARQACELLEPHAWPGPYAVEQLAPPGDGLLTWEPDDLRRTVPYSPILGDLNPTSGRAKLWVDGSSVRGAVVMSAIHAGPVGTVHGGVVAALFDELTSLAIMAAGRVGYTQTLTVNYRRPTPLDAEIELWAQTAGQTGKVFLTAAELCHGGEVTASAVAVHRAAGRRDERVYPEADSARRPYTP
jgi:acyl-coenzyme A thioesterase PaaI-like protein